MLDKKTVISPAYNDAAGLTYEQPFHAQRMAANEHHFQSFRDKNGRLITLGHFDPNDPYYIALRHSDFSAATAIAKERLDRDHHNADLMFDTAFALELSGDHQQSFDLYDRIIAQQPDNGAAWNNAANCLSAMGKNDEAVTYYMRALDCNSNDVTASINLMYLYKDTGNWPEYFNQLKRTMAMTPDSEEARMHFESMKADLGIDNAHDVIALRAAQYDATAQKQAYGLH